MAQAKNFRAVVLVADRIVFDETVTGRKNQPALLQRALASAAAWQGGAILTQTIGARSWGVYLHDKRTGEAVAVYKDAAAAVIDRFANAEHRPGNPPIRSFA